VDEAVFLSDRVIVLSKTSGTVRAEIPIALPRPRSWSRMMEDSTFKALVAKVLALVRDSTAFGAVPASEGPRR
jgi:NitT/TauT family transport system ATP-binding protein